jgi:hypothetical protein
VRKPFAIASRDEIVERLRGYDGIIYNQLEGEYESLLQSEAELLADALMRDFNLQIRAHRPPRPKHVTEGSLWIRRPERKQKKVAPPVRVVKVDHDYHGTNEVHIFWERIEHLPGHANKGHCSLRTFDAYYDPYTEEN